CRHDDVCFEVEVDLLAVLVTQYDLVVAGRHARHRRHRKVREYAAFPEARQDPIVGPEALRILRSDQIDPHMEPLPSRACARLAPFVAARRARVNLPCGGACCAADDSRYAGGRGCGAALAWARR